MPVLLVYGVSSQTRSADLKGFYNALVKATCSLKELDLTNNQVSCFFPADLIDQSKEIIIFVDGLFENPKRTELVRKDLAEKLVECAKNIFPQIDLVECFIRPFDPRCGFAKSERKKDG